MLCSPMFSASAEEMAPQVEEVGPLIVMGGYNVTESHTNSILLHSSNNSILAEDYTATWCENCVAAEHALDEVAESYNVTQFHFHPEIDGQDPFGTAEGDDWWERRYGDRLAPTIIFHGKSKHIGSAAKIKNTLVEDYSISTDTQYSYGEGELEYSWAPQNGGGVVHWNLTPTTDGGGLFPEHSGYTHQFHAFMIEESAYFPEGTNGMENYTNIVSQISFLGGSDSGQSTISVPTAYDGNDMQIFLVLELIPPTSDGVSLVDQKDESQVILYSSIGIGSGVILLLGVILFLRKDSAELDTEIMSAPVNEPTTAVLPAGSEERTAQQLAYEKQMVDSGWDPVQARQYADQQFTNKAS